MTVIELTRELGKAIQADPRYIKYSAARSANDADEELQRFIGEFNMQRMNLNREMSKTEGKDQDKIASMNLSIRELYGQIMSIPHMADFNDAKTDFDDMILEVQNIITLCANGEDPATCEPKSNCTGSCATCGGCH